MTTRKKSRKLNAQQGGDVITVDNTGDNSAIAAGRGAKAVSSRVDAAPELKKWQSEMERRIDAHRDLLLSDKTDLKENVAKVADEVSKGKRADSGRLERLLNTIGSLAPDIFDVAIATLANPLAGLGLVATKIGEKAKLSSQS
jgi:hypothetical protein